MKDDKMILIAYHLLKSSIGTYLEWLGNGLMVTANKIEYKDARLVMLPVDAITHKPDSPAYPWSLFFLLMGKPCRVQLSTQGLFYPIEGDRNMWSGHLCVEISWWAQRGFP